MLYHLNNIIVFEFYEIITYLKIYNFGLKGISVNLNIILLLTS